jgi:hypothetical protein
MSFEITTAHVQQYRNNVLMLAQQQGSRLRAAVMTDSQVGKHAFVDQIGATAAVKKQTRHGDTPLVNTPHRRRRLTLDTFEWADLIDNADQVRTLIDPTSAYAQNAANAMGRSMDDTIIAALLGTSLTDETGATAVVLPAGQKIAVAATSLTLDKVTEAKRLLDAADVDDNDKRYIVISSKELKNLLNTTTFTSADFNSVKALVAGQINEFLGFTWIRSERLTQDATPSRQCIAFTRTGIQMNVGNEPNFDIGPRRDKAMSMQVFVAMDIGATRLEEVKVVEIACTV